MDQRTLLIAVACGLIAAIFFLSPLWFAGLGFALSTFTAMPLFVSVLGFGTIAGAISGVVAAVVVGLVAGPLGALAVFGVTMAPALIIGHLAGLVRNDDGADEWYPLSRILVIMITISAAIALVVGTLSGLADTETLMQNAREMVRGMLAGGPLSGDNAPDEALIERQVANVARLIPFIMPISIMLLMLMNFVFGMRIARRRGWVLRPPEDLPTSIALPGWAAVVFAAATFLALSGGTIGFAGKIVSGAFAGGFILVGFATLHFLTRGMGARTLLLWILYIWVLILSFLALLIVALGVAETLFGLRARRARPTQST